MRKMAHGATLAEADRAALIHLTRHMRSVERRQTLTEEGDLNPRIHIVLEGWACRSKLLSNGKRLITDLILPGDACHPHTNLLGHADHSVTMLSDGLVAEVEAAEIARVLAHQASAAQALHWSSLQVDAILRQALINNGHRLADARIAHLICELRTRLLAVGLVKGDRFAWPLTQEELGQAVAISNVHANRSLMALRADGLIDLTTRVMVVPDLARLAAYCDFRPDYLHLSKGIDSALRT